MQYVKVNLMTLMALISHVSQISVNTTESFVTKNWLRRHLGIYATVIHLCKAFTNLYNFSALSSQCFMNWKLNQP
jgi:hypothetical protein